MEVRDFYYELPEELIAQRPLADRASSRLLVLDKKTGKTEHRRFREITEYIRPGDCLVLNDMRVIPARLFGTKEGTGAPIEFVLLKSRSEEDVKAFLQELPECDPLSGKNYCYWEVLRVPADAPGPARYFPLERDFYERRSFALQKAGIVMYASRLTGFLKRSSTKLA